MAAPTEGTSIPSDGTTDETIAREDEEDEEGKEEGKESRASGEKKGSYRGGTGGGVGDRGAAARRYGVRPSAWDLDLDLDLDSLELAGSSRHGQGGKARSSLVRKDAQGRGVLAALHNRITAAATPEESRTIGGTERGGGACRDSRGPKARQMAGSRARGLGVPGLRGGGGDGGLGGAETRRGGQREGAVAVQLSTAIMQPADFKELAPAPLPEVLQSGKSGVQQGARRWRWRGGALLLSCPRTTATRTGTRARDEVNWTATGSLTRAEWVVLDGLAVGRVEGGKRTTTTGKGRLNKHSNPSFPSPEFRACLVRSRLSRRRTSTLDSQWSLVSGHWTHRSARITARTTPPSLPNH